MKTAISDLEEEAAGGNDSTQKITSASAANLRPRDLQAGTAAPERTNRISSALLFATVALAPLPFGSTDPASIAFWCIVLGSGLIFANPRSLGKAHFALIAGACLVVALYAVVLHEQLAAHPWFAMATPHPLWREASEALGISIDSSVSIARNQAFFALGAPLAAMLSLISSLIVCVDRNRTRQLIQVIAWSGVAYAIYGMFAYVFEPTKILWRAKEAYIGVVTSTFINRNTAAAYFGSCSVIWLLLLSERVRKTLPRGDFSWRDVPNYIFSDMPRERLTMFSMFFICLAAMFMTGSRGGVVISLLALVTAFTAFFRRDLSRTGTLIMGMLAAAAVALILLQIMGAGVSDRFDRQGLTPGGRIETYRATLRMIADHPWFGTGLGTFAWSYPSYRTSDLSQWGTWDRAHNSLLEIAADMGLPLAGVIVFAWLIVLGILTHGAINRRRDVLIPVAAVSVALLALFHSLIDFSLQIPGYAIVVFALVGAGLSQSFKRTD
jgi:O-antigen ligase/polysaccharide polymerase Wzy-like membrane protein